MNHRNLSEALLRLRNDPGFKLVVDWFDSEQQTALKVLTGSQVDRAMYTAQGAYGVVQKFKDLIEGAPSALEKAPR